MSLRISFEVFPPAAGLDALAATVGRLRAADPLFLSVTYGAGGSQSDRSFEALRTASIASNERSRCEPPAP